MHVGQAGLDVSRASRVSVGPWLPSVEQIV